MILQLIIICIYDRWIYHFFNSLLFYIIGHFLPLYNFGTLSVAGFVQLCRTSKTTLRSPMETKRASRISRKLTVFFVVVYVLSLSGSLSLSLPLSLSLTLNHLCCDNQVIIPGDNQSNERQPVRPIVARLIQWTGPQPAFQVMQRLARN